MHKRILLTRRHVINASLNDEHKQFGITWLQKVRLVILYKKYSTSDLLKSHVNNVLHFTDRPILLLECI